MLQKHLLRSVSGGSWKAWKHRRARAQDSANAAATKERSADDWSPPSAAGTRTIACCFAASVVAPTTRLAAEGTGFV